MCMKGIWNTGRQPMDVLTCDITIERIDPSVEEWHVKLQAANTESEPERFLLPFLLADLPQDRTSIITWINQLVLNAGFSTSSQTQDQCAVLIGRKLFDRLFVGSIRSLFTQYRAALKYAESRYSRINIRLILPPELQHIPWELLCDEDGAFLVIDQSISITRYYRSREFQHQPELSTNPFNLVAVSSCPSNLNTKIAQTIDLDTHLQALRDIESQNLKYRVVLEPLSETNTFEVLRQRLQESIDVLHIFCHGVCDTQSGQYVLVLADKNNNIQAVTTKEFVAAIRRQVPLVFINACQSALPASVDPENRNGSLAIALLKKGVLAVIAMQFDLDQKDATILTKVFYERLLDGLAVDRAMMDACIELFHTARDGKSSELAWLTPVLFSQLHDGLLFSESSQEKIQTPDIQVQSVYVNDNVSSITPDEFWFSRGFFRNPFETFSAEQEYAQGTRPFFYKPDQFESWVGDPRRPSSNIIFGQRGVGKTSCRYELARQAGEVIADPALVVSITEFDRLFAARNPADLEHQTRELIASATVLQLHRKLLEYPSRQQSLKDNQEAYKVYQSLFNVYGLAETGALSKKRFFRKSTSLLKVLRLLYNVAHAAQFPSIYIMLDSIDDWPETKNRPEEILRILQPLFNSPVIFHGQGFAFKFFLPTALEQLMKDERVLVLNRVSPQKITWSDSQLLNIVGRRMLGVSRTLTATLPRLSQYCDQTYIDVDSRLLRSAEGSLTQLLMLSAKIVEAHCSGTADNEAPISSATINGILTA